MISVRHGVRRLRCVAKCNVPSYRRSFADNILGHSPMAQGSTPTNESRHIPTAHEAKVSGVWQATSAKRDKLSELKIESPDGNLDAMSTPEQLEDLDLVDGLTLIVKDHQRTLASTMSSDSTVNNEMMEWLQEMASSHPDELHSVQAEELVQRIEVGIAQRLKALEDEKVALCKNAREFYDAADVKDFNPNDTKAIDAVLQGSFDGAVSRFQLQYTRAAAQQFSWDAYTKPTDAGVDRAAAIHWSSAESRSTLSKEKLLAVLANGAPLHSCWNLMAKEDDGLLDQEEMNQVCGQVLKTAQIALKDLMQDALGEPTSRKDKRKHTRFTKDFDKTLQQHVEYELELPHRLRCIYAWANKAHQSNKIDSVLLEEEGGGIATGIMGRKRYVELHPKISLDEFREVQSIHFPEIDEPAVEYLRSFRNDLLVKQGKGRQNRELLRDCSIFFAGVCVIDYIVLAL